MEAHARYSNFLAAGRLIAAGEIPASADGKMPDRTRGSPSADVSAA